MKFVIPYSQQEQLYHGYRDQIKMLQLMFILMTMHGLNATVLSHVNLDDSEDKPVLIFLIGSW